MWRNLNPCAVLVGVKNSMVVPQINDPATVLLGICPEELKAGTHSDMNVSVHGSTVHSSRKGEAPQAPAPG